MNFDILFIGGGPANLACSIHLLDLIEKYNQNIKTNPHPKKNTINIQDKIAIIEKGAYFGAHNISGAIMDPCAIKEIMPNFKEIGFPIESKVKKNSIYILSKTKQYQLPNILTPPSLKNENNYIVSIGKICKWLAEEANKKGAILLPEYTAKEILFNKQNNPIGIKTDSKIWKNNKYNQPPFTLLSKIIVLGDGANGSLSQKLIQKLKLNQTSKPMKYELGCKEIWKLPKNNITKGNVIHTIGYPLNIKKPGGGFIYNIDNDKIAIGIATYLSSKDPKLNTYNELQKLKSHPFIASILKNGKPISYGAKIISAGGYETIPQLVSNNAIILGEAAALLNTKRLKGIHLAIKSGAIAAKVLFQAIKNNNFSKKSLQQYENILQNSWAYKEITNNKGNIKKIYPSLTKLIHKNNKLKDFEKTIPTNKFYKNKQKNIPQLNHDKLSSVFLTNSKYNENEPSNIQIRNKQICINQCYHIYNAPCTNYCPANVYQLLNNKEIIIQPANCIHCKAANLKCPFDNIIWNPPQGGYGPRYNAM